MFSANGFEQVFDDGGRRTIWRKEVAPVRRARKAPPLAEGSVAS
jgi:hypothetical protein